MKPAPQKSVSLEDLLRLKRAERPSTEFWPQFERELRAKQLAALVVQRPWWRTLPARAMVGLSRYHLPLGATAVLALTFLSVREYRTAAPERAVSPLVGEAPVAVAAPAVDVGLTPAGSDRGAPRAEIAADAVATVAQDAGGDGRESGASVADRVSALVGVATETAVLSRPSDRSIAENFAAAQAVEATFGRQSLLVGAARGFESRALPAKMPVVEPLSQVTPPSDVRRARYLGTALPVVANSRQFTPRSSERMASRIADERLYESLGSRLGVGGDRIMVKF
jgi:hypothetical protein